MVNATSQNFIKIFLLVLLLMTASFVEGKEEKNNKGGGDDDDDDDGDDKDNELDVSNIPSDWPSINPTTMINPIHTPTLSPGMISTSSPTKHGQELTSLPTLAPTNQKNDGSVATLLPLMEFTIDGPLTTTKEMATEFFNEFLDDILSHEIREYSASYQSIETFVDVVGSAVLPSLYTVEVAGFAYFSNKRDDMGAKIPTRETLNRILEVYFTVWGADDLNDAMKESSILEIHVGEVRSIALNREKVYEYEEDEATTSISNENKHNDQNLIVGLIVGAVCVCLIIGAVALYIVIRRMKNSPPRQREPKTGKDAVSPTHTDSLEDQDFTIQVRKADDDQSLFDTNMSFVSMYTTAMEGMSVIGPTDIDGGEL